VSGRPDNLQLPKQNLPEPIKAAQLASAAHHGSAARHTADRPTNVQRESHKRFIGGGRERFAQSLNTTRQRCSNHPHNMIDELALRLVQGEIPIGS
jgi:hypothetical protein